MLIMHADCNNFFVSCERIFRPDIQKKPVVVLSANDGCVIARSEEAKTIGIAMCQPYFQIRHLEKGAGLISFSANFELYADISNRIMQRIGQNIPSFEQYSIDECFFEIEEKAALPVARVLKKVLMKELSMPITIGIGRTKSEAKLATYIAKKNKALQGIGTLFSMPTQEKALLYQTLPVQSLWGINRQTEENLYRHGIQNVFSFINTPSFILRKWAGAHVERLALELQGIRCLVFDQKQEHQKQLMHSRSFATPLLCLTDMKEAVSNFSCRAAEKLRRLGLVTPMITISVTTRDNTGTITSKSTSIAIPRPTSCSIELTKSAMKCLNSLYEDGKVYKKAAVLYSGLISAQENSCCFWDEPQTEQKKETVMKAFDTLRSRFGHKALFLAGEGINPAWKSRSTKRSPCYTTCLEELPLVMAK